MIIIQQEMTHLINEYILGEFKNFKCSELEQYLCIIDNALSEDRKKLDRNDSEYIYYEAHHILPKSLFPKYKNDNNNIVLLTPDEHFKCHKLLAEIFPTPEMTFAYWLMSNGHELSAEEYEKIRLKFAKAISKKLKGVSKSESHREHIRQARIGLSYGNLTEEHKQKISNALKGNVTPSELNRQRCSDRCKKRTGKNNTQSRRVRCIEDDLIFETVNQCEKYYNVPHLYRYCSTGKVPSKLNKHFEYV